MSLHSQKKTKLGPAAILFLELVFVASFAFSFVIAGERKPGLQQTTAAIVYLGSALPLLVISILIRKEHPRYAYVAWITLLLALVCGLMFPVLK